MYLRQTNVVSINVSHSHNFVTADGAGQAQPLFTAESDSLPSMEIVDFVHTILDKDQGKWM